MGRSPTGFLIMTASSQMTVRGTTVWLICALFFMYEFLLRTVIGTFQYPITQDLHLTSLSFALISSSAYQLAYGSMQIPVGFITDRHGLKKALFFAAGFCSIATLGFSFSHEFYTAILFRLLMGLGSSFGFVCLLVAVYDWMPRKNIGFFIGLSQFIGTMGPMLAAGPIHTLSTNSGINWRSIFFILALVGFILTLLVFLFVDKNYQTKGRFTIITRPLHISHTLGQLLTQKQIWYIALYSGLVYFSIEYLSENEGLSYLKLNHYSGKFSSYMITLAWVGYALGCPLLGLISDMLQKRKPILILAAACSFISIVCIVYYPINKTVLSLSFLLLGIGASGQSIGFAVMAEQCKESYLAAGLGFNNAIITLVSAINAPLVGYLLTKFSSTHANQFQLDDYHKAFSVIILLIFFGLLISIVAIKETFCKKRRENTILTVSQ
jgi:MFS family permease